MDLLAGYGSDSSSSDAPPPKQPQPTVAPKPAPSPPSSAAAKPKKKGKRLLSLQAVLPPEIFDRLSRPEGADSDSDDEKKRETKRPKRVGGRGDRSGVNSLLDELRTAPLQKGVSSAATSKSNEGSLGLAFMSYTTESKSKKSDDVVDIHGANPKPVETSKPNDVEPQQAAPKKRTFNRISAAAPVPMSMQQSVPEQAATTTTAYPVQETMQQQQQPTTAYASYAPSQSHSITNHPQFTNSRKQRREQERSLRSGAAFHHNTKHTMEELHQPSPTEYAPTAHMAAIASKAAHLRNLGNIDPTDTSDYGEYSQERRKAMGVAMYDPKTGTDVKGGVTGKHKSKHQINQLMVSAMGLEASRAGEAELARLGLGGGGGKTGGGRAEAKSKYGW